MFDILLGRDGTGAPSVADLDRALAQLAGLDGADAGEDGQISLVAALERLKGAVAAAQARVTDSLVHSRSTREAERGVPEARRCQGLAAEIALARRCSPHRGSRDLGLARALVREMPRTLDLLTRGEISEWRATIVARETAVLSVEHRAHVDAELAEKLAGLGDREAGARARSIGYRLDPESAVRRTRLARADRFVSLRPAPDAMSYLTALLPVQQGVACLAALRQAADTVRNDGGPGRGAAGTAGDEPDDEPRSRGQVMADTLVERLTGQARATDVDVEVHVVMTDSSLLTDDHTPAEVVSYGPIHAALAREIVRDAPRAWLRRLFTRPGSGDLVATDSRRRTFSGELRELLVVRDQVCRTPWCDAPVRHTDHVVPVSDGGETSLSNGQGLCEACNYAKEAPGWRAMPLPSDRHQVLTVTPTGHTHVSTAPDPPGWWSPPITADLGDVAHTYTVWRTLEEDLRLVTAGGPR
ncbi:HNH endonuclease signature motif containing protein [Nocardioides korecus]